MVLSTGHRRENLGAPLRRILRALRTEIVQRSDTMLVHIGHPNPAADRDARLALKGINRIHVIPPVDYPDLVAMLDRASVIVTDSGGLQEEAPSFGIPVLVTREITERPEVLKCGGILIGTDPSRLRAGMQSALRRTGSRPITPCQDAIRRRTGESANRQTAERGPPWHMNPRQKKAGRDSSRPASKIIPAVTYSPTKLPPQYHRR